MTGTSIGAAVPSSGGVFNRLTGEPPVSVIAIERTCGSLMNPFVRARSISESKSLG